MMRSLAVILASLVGCAGAPVVRPAPPSGTAEPPVVAARQSPEPRRMQPTDPPPVFLDPERRAKLEAAFPVIDAYLQQTVARDRLVGLAAGVVIDGELAWFRGYGHRDPARGLPVERDSVFGVGSITKTFTALAVLKLRDEGRLDLDRPAASYLPALDDIAYPTADSPRFTVRQILTHTAGLPRMGNFAEYPETPPGRAEFLATLAGIGLDRPPGERRVYSNLGFQLLGPLVEEVAGVDHRRYVRDQILTPLGMTSTVWAPEDVPGDRLAIGHERAPEGTSRPRPHWRPGAADAAGGLYSSVEDLARYAAFNLAAWPARDEAEVGPLRRATVREAHALAVLTSFAAASIPAAPARVHISGSGLGFGVQATCRFDHVVALAGKTLNYRASLHMLPGRGVAVILLSNQSSIGSTVLPTDGARVLDLLADTGALESRRPAPAPALTRAAGELAALVGRWDDAAHARLFAPDFRDSNPPAALAAKFAGWHALVGTCGEPRPVAIEDPRAGSFEATCERGVLRLELRVAPWAGAPVSSFTAEAAGLAAAPALVEAAEGTLRLLRRWDEREFVRLHAANFDAGRARADFAEAARLWGRCRLGPPRVQGPLEATFALYCDAGAPTLRLKLSATAPAKIVEFNLRASSEGPCQ
ncbi:serine hydrolase [Nannocystis sp. ILAH1]|uniref:serine hydrolase domain-containing protein n=1 Tax=Nannocystis sp. ILAH1 TaxID=2996789 RepID=UPI00226F3627|nr:serine hydrolase domain-containing protein [Nannocystis sp. ILAH1]MCY0994409.1 serine hydrolase [Nannocystis sp. ILAH1]